MNVICWLVIHLNSGSSDNRDYKPFKGYIMKSAGDTLLVNFSKAFKKQRVNLISNQVVQIVKENACLYE